MTADPLSEVLRTVRLTGAIFYGVIAREPWVAEQPPQREIIDRILPDADHLISYHVLTDGHCYANVVGGEPMALHAGEVVVFTHGDPHILSSAPGMRAPPGAESVLDIATSGRSPFFLEYGSGGAPATFICGFLACDATPFNPLLDSLPRVLKVGDSDRDAGWLAQFARLVTAESAARRAGRDGVLAKLSELMFIGVVRRYAETLPAGETGWLAGLSDPPVARALALIHGAPARDWTIEELGREAGVSRSVLAERFAARLGIPPMHYLARWRMQAALRLLADGVAIAEVADRVGYGSEAAFSRAFKKLFGEPPSAWRHRHAAGAG